MVFAQAEPTEPVVGAATQDQDGLRSAPLCRLLLIGQVRRPVAKRVAASPASPSSSVRNRCPAPRGDYACLQLALVLTVAAQNLARVGEGSTHGRGFAARHRAVYLREDAILDVVTRLFIERVFGPSTASCWPPKSTASTTAELNNAKRCGNGCNDC
ncbi:hypothetical protein [Saccharopolyspora mangrovi]|uniref:Uncharacterized protein n=1 Tax=Saccharopolyspora mangrovi TaxID=3082379 RepID=A0ABU6AJ38_9PSEU|nr:hypothetical protein [Saccharopolyspora sp. S2-29]MEB3371325.1 hypothetical protein [Saccharopolyspora sp. S2-29]